MDSSWSKGLRKNTEVWLLLLILVKSDAALDRKHRPGVRGHRSYYSVREYTLYRTHAKWWGIAGEAPPRRTL